MEHEASGPFARLRDMFHPRGPCLCRRVLIPVRANGTGLSAWLYGAAVTEYLGFKSLPSGKWRY